MNSIFKSFLVLVSLFVFSFSVYAAPSIPNRSQAKGTPVVKDDLPSTYAWYVVANNKPASELMKGNLRKTFQVFTERQGAVTIAIDNYEDGGSAFNIAFNDIDENRVTITFNKSTVASFLQGEDPRKDYEEPLRMLVRNNVLYFGMLKSYFKV